MARTALRGLLVLLLVSLLALQSSVPYKRSSFYGAAEPHMTSIVRWEARNILPALWQGALSYRQGIDLSQSQQKELLERYFSPRSEGQQKGPAVDSSQVESILAYQLSQALKELQLGAGIGPLSLSPFPPVTLKLGKLPNILVVSPRQRISLLDTVPLDSDLSLEEMVELEKRVENLGLSALVERIGGIATYPSLISETTPLEAVFTSIAHEWLHQYFFFNPLGRRYWTNEEMATLNETAADIAGQEIGDKLYRLYFGERKKGEESRPDGNFFARELRRIRLGADDYLAQGKVKEAEQLMEEGRNILAQRGYHLRKLNQAYFAFHGTYADSPASTSPIAGELKELRKRSTSLSEFIKTVASLRSHRDLEQLLSR